MKFSSSFQGKQYSRDSFFFMPAIKRCHTADILAPAGKKEARLMQVSPQPGPTRPAQIGPWNSPAGL